jgi:hypothetical protein
MLLLWALIAQLSGQASADAVRSRPADIAFRVQMIDAGFSESVAVADFNRDGRLDILSAEYWYEAPRWTKHKIRDIHFNGSYIDNQTGTRQPVGAPQAGVPAARSVRGGVEERPPERSGARGPLERRRRESEGRSPSDSRTLHSDCASKGPI